MTSAPRTGTVAFGLFVLISMSAAVSAQANRDPEAVSPLGRLLYAKADNETNGTEFAAVEAARDALANADNDREFRAAVLGLGGALDAVWRYREAVSVYSRGLSRFPDDGELFLRRGTASLRLRNFDRALEDLRTAVRRLDGDFESNYRLGHAQFLDGDFRRAGRTMVQAADFASNDDELIASLQWAYASFKRAKRRSEADEVLARVPIEPRLSVNTDYLRLIQMYRGLTGEFSVFDQDAAESERSSTRGFGVANWHLAAGSERAGEVLRSVVEGADWPAIGVIAAEVELERLGR